MSKKQEFAAILSSIIANVGLILLCAGAPTVALADPTAAPQPLNEGEAAISQAEDNAINALLDKEDALQKQEMELQAKEEAMRAKEKELQAKEEAWQTKEQELQAQVASVQEKLTAAQEEAAKCAAPPPKKKKKAVAKKKPKPRPAPKQAAAPRPAAVTYAPTAQPLAPLAAPAPAPAVVVPPGSSYTLNTVYEHQAWIQGADQRTYAVREGDIINGMRIISIDAANRRVQTSHGAIE